MTIASKFAYNQLASAVSACFGQVISADYFMDVTAAQLTLDNIIDLGILPAGHTVSDAILIPDDLDTHATPLVALDVGIMSGTPGDITSVRTCGAELFAADIGARTAAAARMTLASGFKILATGADRSIGVKVQAIPATAAAGRIRLRVFMHASDTALQF